MQFAFTGRSRQPKVQLARDNVLRRAENLQEVRRRREERELAHRRASAATTIQRVFRRSRGRAALQAHLAARLVASSRGAEGGGCTQPLSLASALFLITITRPTHEIRQRAADAALAAVVGDCEAGGGGGNLTAVARCGLLSEVLANVVLAPGVLVRGVQAAAARSATTAFDFAGALFAALQRWLEAADPLHRRSASGRDCMFQRAIAKSVMHFRELLWEGAMGATSLRELAGELLRRVFLREGGRAVAGELDDDALVTLAAGGDDGTQPLGIDTLGSEDPRHRCGSLLQLLLALPAEAVAVVSAPDVARFDDAALAALRGAGGGRRAMAALRLLLRLQSGSFAAIKRDCDDSEGTGGGSDAFVQLRRRLVALQDQVECCDAAELVHALLAAVGSGHPSDPLADLYSPRMLGLFPSLSQRALAAATREEATIALECLDALAAPFVGPWLRFAVTPTTRREVLPLMSRVALTTGVISSLWSVISRFRERWVQKDGRGSLVVRLANVSILFCVALQHYVDSTNFAECIRGSSDTGSSPVIGESDDDGGGGILSREDVRGVVVLLRGLVYRAHMHGCAVDAATRAFARASHTLLARLHAVDEADSFIERSEWLIPNGDVPAMLSSEEWAEGMLAEDGAVSSSSSSSDDDHDEGDGGRRASSDDEDSGGRRGGGVPRPQRARREVAVIGSLVGHGGRSDALHRRGRGRGKKRHVEFDPQGSRATRTVQLLQHAPFLIPFPTRVVYFSGLMLSTRSGHDRYWGDEEVVIDRGNIFQSAFNKLNALTPQQLLGKTRIRFRSVDGTLEEGFGDGVFRDFVASVCATGFDPSNGLFERNDRGFLSPRPFTDHLQRFEFLGKFMGKALRHGILLDVPLAPFFRNALLGRLNTISDLRTFDEELYRNLVRLRHASDAELAEYDLRFVINLDVFGAVEEVELVPGGAERTVTRDNVTAYVHLMADFKLNRLARQQMSAFRRGLEQLVNPHWLRFFDSNELQLLFQGSEDEIGLDVADWREHTTYSGHAGGAPAAPDHPAVRLFWRVVEAMAPSEQRQLLKFVTSVSRAPLLGFRHMSPPFNVALSEASDRLPTAATCMCMLKLPAYATFETMQKKLLLAIEENTFGFS